MTHTCCCQGDASTSSPFLLPHPLDAVGNMAFLSISPGIPPTPPVDCYLVREGRRGDWSAGSGGGGAWDIILVINNGNGDDDEALLSFSHTCDEFSYPATGHWRAQQAPPVFPQRGWVQTARPRFPEYGNVVMMTPKFASMFFITIT